MTTNLADILGELEKLHAAATAGPWSAVDIAGDWHLVAGKPSYDSPRIGDSRLARSEADCALIAAMRNHLPVLLSDVPELLRVATAARSVLTLLKAISGAQIIFAPAVTALEEALT